MRERRDAFEPPDGGWCPVSPQLMAVRRLVLAVVVGLAVVVASVLLAALGAPAGGAALVVVGALVFGIGWRVIGRQWRALGYAERDEDLLVVRGVLFRQLVVVPYGRMQFVDVTAGPVDRRFGIAALQLHTASAGTDASIPGLPADEAARLRDRLAALGGARTGGL